MKLRRYCVTVMDNWTPVRLFWTRGAALQFRDSLGDHAHAYRWDGGIGSWMEMYACPVCSRPQQRGVKK